MTTSGGVSAWKSWASTVWKCYLQPSHVFTLWMPAHRRLPTQDKQNYLEDRRCTFYALVEETQEYLFFGCWLVGELRRIRWWLHMHQEMSTYRRMLKIFTQHCQGINNLVKARHLAMSSMIHYVWMARNYSMFEGVRIDVEDFQKSTSACILVLGHLIHLQTKVVILGQHYTFCLIYTFTFTYQKKNGKLQSILDCIMCFSYGLQCQLNSYDRLR